MRQMRDAIVPDFAKLLSQSTIQGRIEPFESQSLERRSCRARGKRWTKRP